MQATDDPRPAPPPGEEPAAPGAKLTDKAAETYKWWNNLATINAEDPFLVGAAKIGIRLLGILVLLALSPLILLGLIVAFITVL
jgi:hypothetical protein